MKRSICLFLMLWLPLFTGSAWAMSAQMQFDKLQTALEVPAKSAEPPCHEMQHGEMQHERVHQTAQSTDQKHNTHCNGHNCFACGVCIYASSFATPVSPQIFTPMLSHAKLVQFNETFVSQRYPPALKPPISA